MVRHATPKDVDHLVTLGWKGHSISNNQHLPVSENKWRRTIEGMLLRPWNSCVLVSENGFLLGQLAEYPYADGKFAIDVAFFARGDGRSFLRMFAEWAKKKGALEMVIVNSSGIERTDTFLERSGMSKVGSMFVRSL